ncbi:MAG TPA: DUF190 domain-containing protein [Phnomibacter sp.]|nr:DUF190 domain-containing protein [Phnomibacter sp.]
MTIQGEAKKLRFYISSTDKFKHNLLYEMIIYSARRNRLAGASVLKGIMGFGSGAKVHSLSFSEINDKLPIIIEIIDEKEKIERFVEKIKPWFDKISTGCIITIEPVEVVLHKQGKIKKFWEF